MKGAAIKRCFLKNLFWKLKQKNKSKSKLNKIYAKSMESTGEEFIFSKVVGLQLFIAFD